MRFLRLALALSLACVLLIACGDDTRVGTGGAPDASVDLGGTGLCAGGDADEDTIATADEGSDDADMDGLPNAEDTDSDGDGILDIEEAGDRDCATPPVDTDDDGIPAFLDLDSNGDGPPDALQGEVDPDMDGLPARNHPDLDRDHPGHGPPRHRARRHARRRLTRRGAPAAPIVADAVFRVIGVVGVARSIARRDFRIVLGALIGVLDHQVKRRARRYRPG